MTSRIRNWLCPLALASALALPAPAGATEVFTSNGGANSISLFSVGPAGSLAPISCGTNCDTGAGPAGVVVSPNGRFLYAANSLLSSDSISPFAIGADGTLAPTPCSGTNCDTGSEPGGLAVSPNGRFLYAADNLSDAISPFAIAADGTLAPIPCPAMSCATGSHPLGLAVSPNGLFLYAANSTNTISPYAIGADGSLTPINCAASNCVAASAGSLAVSPNGKFVYTASGGSNTVSPFAINGDGSLAPIPCGGSSCNTGMTPQGVAVSPNGKFLYAASSGSNTVSPFAINGDGSLAPIPCPGSSCNAGLIPIAVAVSPDSHFLFATNFSSSTVSPFAIAGDGSLTQIPCPGSSCNTGSAPSSFSVAISPDQAPLAAFSATAGFVGKPTHVDGRGSGASAGQTVAGYDWAFGDGSTAPNGGPTPTHAYAAPGTYTVSLTVTDDAGCSTTQTFTGQTVSCNGGPQARVSHQVTIATAPPPTKPPNTKITKAKVSSTKRRAIFKFKAAGTASGFQCELKRKHAHKNAKFKKCRSPKTYKKLKAGKYTFEVRAVGPGGSDRTPAKKKFKIKR